MATYMDAVCGAETQSQAFTNAACNMDSASASTMYTCEGSSAASSSTGPAGSKWTITADVYTTGDCTGAKTTETEADDFCEPTENKQYECSTDGKSLNVVGYQGAQCTSPALGMGMFQAGQCMQRTATVGVIYNCIVAAPSVALDALVVTYTSADCTGGASTSKVSGSCLTNSHDDHTTYTSFECNSANTQILVKVSSIRTHEILRDGELHATTTDCALLLRKLCVGLCERWLYWHCFDLH